VDRTLFSGAESVGIANQLTLLRLLLSPVFVLVFILGGTAGHALALAIAIAFEVTDLLDGHFARSRKETSDFGKLFDPMTDSIARFSVFLCFLWGGYAHLWMVALVFYRDLCVAYIRVAAARARMVLAARLSGKVKAITQGIVILAILLLILWTPQDDPLRVAATQTTAHWLMGLVVLVTLWSAFDYARSALPILRKLLARK
jgi:CDP-diacylglycerol--glycerol-3-phosphate 3-phosphatidyltransferase